ncbi:enoyl-CoA hydratase/isomerase family protein [Variovorax sp. 770b2]|uniref:enoyl-CoA hydratase/isomerase family protein n=1 Tax=Variovorax sp. 770b2 TaxID=1566271 RepID=UPI0008E32417|nr:enoyl-CoA hydratase/isomerase family protein [Variovorax sp. 770b2]SFP26713.1 short chain enoyl-CoA hydratase [Variovorax sp. 770b2]
MTPSETAKAETIRLERRGAVAWLFLDRPEAMNSMSPQMVRELGEALDRIESDAGLRAVVITGNGRAFCAGADLKTVKDLGGQAQRESATRRFLDEAGALLRRIERLPLPVIAAVNGLALAGGLETVLVCDLVVASEDAKFGDAHAKYGLIPGWGGSVRLPRKIGASRAKQMMFTAEHVPARTMAEWGLVNQVVPAAQLHEAAQALCDRITDKSPLGLARMKQLVDDGLEQPLDVALRAECTTVQTHQASRDRAEGLAAFAEKRTPRFDGT